MTQDRYAPPKSAVAVEVPAAKRRPLPKLSVAALGLSLLFVAGFMTYQNLRASVPFLLVIRPGTIALGFLAVLIAMGIAVWKGLARLWPEGAAVTFNWLVRVTSWVVALFCLGLGGFGIIGEPGVATWLAEMGVL